MLINKNLQISLEIERISKYIANWLYSNEQFLNVITVPHNSSLIFMRGIADYLDKGKKVLYITNEDESCIDLLTNIKKNTYIRDYSYLRTYNVELEKSLIVCNFKNAIKINKKFDLVIYDDIRSLPMYNKYEIIDIMAKNCKEKGKFIAYSIESVFKKKREIVLPVLGTKTPIVEPRVITTKIDLNNDIPYTIYDYLRWAMKYEKKIVIYVPDEKKLYRVFKYLNTYCKDLNKNLVYFSKEDKDLKTVFNFLKIKKGIMVTDDFKENIYQLIKDKEINEIVFFANHYMYDYKKLVYFCGEKAWIKKNIMKEVIFFR